MTVLVNHVILETGVPARLHFTDHRIERRTITDPVTGEGASRQVLVFNVDRLDGHTVAAQYSTMSDKHASQFEPYLAEKQYRDFEFTIVRSGEGFRTSYSVHVTPLKKPG